MAADTSPNPRRIVVDVVETASELPPRATEILDAVLSRHDRDAVRALVEGTGTPEARAVLEDLVAAFERPGFPVVDGLSAEDALIAALGRAEERDTDGPVAVLLAPVDEVLWEWVTERVA